MAEWILMLGGTLFLYACLKGIAYLWGLRRRGMKNPLTYEDPGGRFTFHYPREWDLEPMPHGLRIVTNDHDGRILIRTTSTNETPREEFLRDRLQDLALDDPSITTFEVARQPGAFIETRATQKSNQERMYLQEWVLDGSSQRLALSYRCSVLYGLVDGFFIDQMIRSVRFGPGPKQESLLPVPNLD